MAVCMSNALGDVQRTAAISRDPEAHVVHQGWLGKKGYFTRRWKPLYFLLWSDGNFIGYQKAPSDVQQKPVHRFKIGHRQIEACYNVNSSEKYKFYLRGAHGKLSINRTFKTETYDGRDLWLKALTQVKRKVMHEWNAQLNVSPSAIEDYEIIRQIGKGAFGSVELCRKRKTGKLYAIKTVSKESLPENFDVSVYSEKDILAKNDHPFLTKLYKWFQSDAKLFLVMEYASGGNLASYLKRKKRLTESDACFYAAQISAAIGHLHRRRVIYRDLKPDNVLIAADGYLKLADFGISRKFDNVGGTARLYCGTLSYVAPEVVQCWEYGQAVDWWSLGIVLFEMITGRTPFKQFSARATTASIIFDSIMYPHYVSGESRGFINQLLQKSPMTRLGSNTKDFVEVKRHPFFKSIDWEDLLSKKIRPSFVPSLTSEEDTRYFVNIPSRQLPD